MESEGHAAKASDLVRTSPMKFPDNYRVIHGERATRDGEPFGAFLIPPQNACGRALRIIAADGAETGWDHVSVSLFGWENKQPSWGGMCLVKSLFWDDAECVVQFHPPASDYVNVHNGCLHLWKQVNAVFPMPPKICV